MKLGDRIYSFIKDVLTKSLVLAFITLLIIAAIALGMGLDHVANRLAEIAYYNLVLAVIIQLIIVIREEKE